MVKIVGDDRSQIQYLERHINDKGYQLPSNATDTDYRGYQKRVMNYFLSLGEQKKVINDFLAKVDASYSASFPSENELGWFRNDPRASLWLVCELFEDMKKNGFESHANTLSPEKLLPVHDVRVDALRYCINNWPFNLITQDEYFKSRGIEWADLIDKHNLFRDVNAKMVDTCSWLKKHIQENTPISLNRICGESPDEIMAWCYASYFMWKKKNQLSPDSVELFVRKFKSTWSTQKNRIKNKVEKNLKPLNVNISQKSHNILRHIATEEAISNDRVIESALDMLYKSKKGK
ncbi:hypothetical protein [Enterobacter ludwigii]